MPGDASSTPVIGDKPDHQDIVSSQDKVKGNNEVGALNKTGAMVQSPFDVSWHQQNEHCKDFDTENFEIFQLCRWMMMPGRVPRGKRTLSRSPFSSPHSLPRRHSLL